MACDPETCDSATNQLKTGHTETRDQQLAAQSPTTQRRQETREQMPEAGDHAARVQEGAKRQESRRLEYPKAKGGPRFRTGGRKKQAAHHHPKNISICSNHKANSFYDKKSRQLRQKNHVQKSVFRQLTEQLLPVPSAPILSAVFVSSFHPPPRPLLQCCAKMELGLATLFPRKGCLFKNDVGKVHRPTLKGGGVGDRRTFFEKAM